MLGLERRLPQLMEDVSMLERENDGELYAVISLQLVENELLEIQQLIDRLNTTTLGHQRLTTDTTEQVNSQHQLKHQPQVAKKMNADLKAQCVQLEMSTFSAIWWYQV